MLKLFSEIRSPQHAHPHQADKFRLSDKIIRQLSMPSAINHGYSLVFDSRQALRTMNSSQYAFSRIPRINLSRCGFQTSPTT